MNRKQRRAAAKQGGGRPGAPSTGAPSAVELAEVQASGLAHHQAGRLPQAEACYRKVLAAEPGNVDALHLLGVLARQAGQPGAAVDLIAKAVGLNGRIAELHTSLGNALMDLGRTAEAEACYRRAVALKPEYAAAHNNLGNVLQGRGEYREAEDCYRRALALDPRYPAAHGNLGATLLEQAKSAEAEASCRAALALKPDFAAACSNLGNALSLQGRSAEAEAYCRRALTLESGYPEGHNNLGNILKDQGRLDEAEACYRRALDLKPNLAEAHNNLGLLAKDHGKLAAAEACYRRAIALRPGYADAHCNLGQLLLDRGDSGAALDLAQAALAAKESAEAKVLFVRCISHAVTASSHPVADAEVLRRNLLRALTEPWGRPSQLARYVAGVLKEDPTTGGCVKRVNEAWPSRPLASLAASDWAALGNDRLLIGLIESTPVYDIELERFLTTARRSLLEAVAATSDPRSLDGVMKFGAALAQQCFVNDYVFALAEGELDQALRLREALAAALAAGGPVPAIWLACVASYFPLSELPAPDAILHQTWPQELDGLLTRQVREPLADRDARASIPRLTPVTDGMSLLVQQQYEENPYPRWIATAAMLRPTSLDVWLHRQLPLARLRDLGGADGIQILIAGCGTGQHSIETAQRLVGVDLLAVDLSLTSLCYAQRKSRALGLTRLHYAQADILQLGAIGKTFDLIEVSGVLHHLADPLAGWRVLVSLLRPGGIMRVGLYSELARSHLAAARAFIATGRYGQSADDIRRFRQDFMATEPETAAKIAELRDFFSLSECRDLLFHHQEHRFTLPQISAFLTECGLEFLGFDVEGSVLQQFRERFPDLSALTDLDLWHLFETEHPHAFIGMYQFFVQRP
jgi:tetratricopeptide (TPR) repeat protein/SAM-dependent methyltransferase